MMISKKKTECSTDIEQVKTYCLSALNYYVPSAEFLDLVRKWTPVNRKPIHDLVNSALRLGIIDTANKLGVYPEFVVSWMPRRLQCGKMESGWGPSGGFIAMAIARIGYVS